MFNAKFKNQLIKINTHKVSFLGKFLGLMFSNKEKASVLLFDWGRDVSFGIHSFFVFYDFLAVWLDSKKRVIQIDKVKPFKTYIGCKKKYRYLVEIPINRKNKKLVNKFCK